MTDEYIRKVDALAAVKAHNNGVNESLYSMIKHIPPADIYTFEMLKAAASKYGYSLLKREPYIKFKPCRCGCNRRSIYSIYNCATGESGVQYRCNKCNRESPIGKTEKEAKILWNKMIEELEEEDKCEE